MKLPSNNTDPDDSPGHECRSQEKSSNFVDISLDHVGAETHKGACVSELRTPTVAMFDRIFLSISGSTEAAPRSDSGSVNHSASGSRKVINTSEISHAAC